MEDLWTKYTSSSIIHNDKEKKNKLTEVSKEKKESTNQSSFDLKLQTLSNIIPSRVRNQVPCPYYHFF